MKQGEQGSMGQSVGIVKIAIGNKNQSDKMGK
jgi:hypothetical protein